MAAGTTLTATLLGTYRSKLTATPMSSATGSVDFLTIAHQLTTIPDEVRLCVRSVVTTGTSGSVPVPVVRSYNGSQVIVDLPLATGAANNITVDVIVELSHSVVR